jgi:hypothetical protein
MPKYVKLMQNFNKETPLEMATWNCGKESVS